MKAIEYVRLCEKYSAAVHAHNRFEEEGGTEEVEKFMNLEERLQVVGDVDLKGNQNIAVLPRASIKGNLTIENCRNIEKIDVLVQGNVNASGSGVKIVSSDFSCGGDLNLTRTANLSKLEGKIDGNIYINGSKVRETGPDLYCGGTLCAGDSLYLDKINGKFKNGAIAPEHDVDVQEGIEFWRKSEAQKAIQSQEPSTIPSNVVKVDFLKLSRPSEGFSKSKPSGGKEI